MSSLHTFLDTTHLAGETADDGIDQGGGHGIGDVEEDEGD